MNFCEQKINNIPKLNIPQTKFDVAKQKNLLFHEFDDEKLAALLLLLLWF